MMPISSQPNTAALFRWLVASALRPIVNDPGALGRDVRVPPGRRVARPENSQSAILRIAQQLLGPRPRKLRNDGDAISTGADHFDVAAGGPCGSDPAVHQVPHFRRYSVERAIGAQKRVSDDIPACLPSEPVCALVPARSRSSVIGPSRLAARRSRSFRKGNR